MKYSHHQTKYIGKEVWLRTYQHPGSSSSNRGSNNNIENAGDCEHYISFQSKFYKTSGLQYTYSIYLL